SECWPGFLRTEWPPRGFEGPSPCPLEARAIGRASPGARDRGGRRNYARGREGHPPCGIQCASPSPRKNPVLLPTPRCPSFERRLKKFSNGGALFKPGSR